MKKLLRLLLASALVLLPLAEASAGNSTITTKDAAGATKTFFVVTDGSGNFYAAGVLCDQSAAATCASVGTAGSPSTNALTVQAVTLGSGTAAIAQRVELANNGTGVLATVGTVTTVTTLSTLTGGGVASGAADSGNPLKIGGKYNAAPPSLTDGNRGDLQLGASGAIKQIPGTTWGAITTWGTGTAANTNLVLSCGDSAPAVVVDLVGSGTITTGVISFQYSNDATDCSGTTGTWVNLSTSNVVDQFAFSLGTNPWTAVTGQTTRTILPNGARATRARLTTALTGASAQVIVSPTVSAPNPTIGALLGPIAAGPNIIGSVRITQETPGTSNGIAIVGVNAATALAGNGATGTGSLRVTIADNNSPLAVNATLGAETTKVIGTVRNVGNVGGVFDAVSGAAVPANLLYTGVNVGGNITPVVGDPCQTVAKSYTPINMSTATTFRVAAETSAKKTYICHVHVVGAAADNVALFEGTGATCTGGTPVGMAGGITAATGWNFSANGGISLGTGGYAVLATANANYSVCLITSAATQLSGHVAWVQQ